MKIEKNTDAMGKTDAGEDDKLAFFNTPETTMVSHSSYYRPKLLILVPVVAESALIRHDSHYIRPVLPKLNSS